MTDDGDPIGYPTLVEGTPVRSADGHEIAHVKHVLFEDDVDLFDGIIVDTKHGTRFIDADQVTEITTTHVGCTVSDAEVENLPKPDAAAVYDVNMAQAESKHVWDRVKRAIKGGDWKREGSD
ncbi:MAG: hypothetical protein QOG53_591 [Frankiales bacterium]|jgi:uncharacterized protein YrrD|nr:hypothetical protein [Frankiales bacterium]